MTKFLKPIIFILGIAALLYNCQRDKVTDISQTEINNSAFKVRTVKLTQIPAVKSFLLEKSKNNIFSQKTIIDGAIFDQDNIMEVIDTLNQTNYSFKFTYPDTPLSVFYNLVVGKTSEGVLLDPYVLKYTVDSTYVEEFLSNNYDFSYFKGTVAVHKYTDFFTSNLGFKTNATYCPTTYDANGDPIPCNVTGLSGSGTGSGGGGSTGGSSFSGGPIGFTTCTTIVTYAPCGCGGNADGHPPSGAPCCHGSPVIIELSCPPYQKMNSGNKATGTTPCPDCPSGSNGGVGVNLGDVALTNIINTLQLGLKDPKTLWLKSTATPAELLAMNTFLTDNNNSVEAITFINEAIDALMNGIFVDFDEAYIGENYQDDNYIFQGVKQLIPTPLVLSNGEKITVTFITHTKDNLSSNQKVSVDVINGLKFALEQANSNLTAANKITSINIYATTNGHGTTGDSNHLKATAIDINSINGNRMTVTGLTPQITELQKAFDNYQYIRENFGPYLKHKYSVESNTWNLNYPVSGHTDHIHISVRR